MIHAVGRDPAQGIVTAADACWGLDLAERSATELIEMIGAHVSGNEREATCKRMLNLIGMAGKKGITQSELTNKTQDLKQQERKEILEDLQASGQVVSEMVPTNGRPRHVWRRVKL